MRKNVLASIGAATIGVLVSSLFQVRMESRPRDPENKRPVSANGGLLPQTAWGDPDLEGVWSNPTLTPLQRPEELAGKAVLTPDEAAAYQRLVRERGNTDRRDGGAEADLRRAYNDYWYERSTYEPLPDGRTSLIVDPPDGRLPSLTESAKQRKAANLAQWGPLQQDELRRGGWVDELLPWTRCITRGVPEMMIPNAYNANYQIFQSQGYVAIYYEMVHETRIIPIGNRPHLPPNVRLWLGDSVGRWEGSTLVVDTTNFNGKTGYGGTINGQVGPMEPSANLHVVERFTRVDASTIMWEATLDDATMWTRPWTLRIPLSRSDSGHEIFEYACHEGNHALLNMLSGARAKEAADDAAKKGAPGSLPQH